MRRAPAALAATLVLLLVAADPGWAKSFTLPDADVQVRVARDGGVVVRESITFDYDGSFTGAFREIPLRAGESVDRISVAEGKNRYVPGGSLTLGTEGPASQYGAGVVDGKQRIVWPTARPTSGALTPFATGSPAWRAPTTTWST